MSNDQNIKTNVPEFSVGELAFSLKKTLEDTFGRVRVRGELSRVSVAASGHMYSSLKDNDAVIDAVCWKGVLGRLSVKPEEGLEVICTGRISSYPKSSKYQLVIESMELAGEGALLKMLEERRKKLAAEGLIAAERKRALPVLPEVIGVVTSPTGAVIRDILHRLRDRFPRHVLLWPVMVQGEGAANQIAAAIEGFQTIDKHGLPRPDVLIVGRGGGSLEDLMAFNEESVVRAAAASAIPLISAVGHETDTTLMDYAADMRAPTPTGAAEIAVPMRADLMARIMENEQRYINAANRLIADQKNKTEALSARLGDPARMLESHTQKLDHTGDKLGRIYSQYLAQKSERLNIAGAKIRTPKDRLAEAQQKLSRWGEQLHALAPRLSKEHQSRLDHLTKMLEAYSFKNVLDRGFAVVRSADGTLIDNAGAARKAGQINLQFKNNESVDALISGSSGAVRPKKSRKKKENETQQNLFD